MHLQFSLNCITEFVQTITTQRRYTNNISSLLRFQSNKFRIINLVNLPEPCIYFDFCGQRYILELDEELEFMQKNYQQGSYTKATRLSYGKNKRPFYVEHMTSWKRIP